MYFRILGLKLIPYLIIILFNYFSIISLIYIFMIIFNYGYDFLLFYFWVRIFNWLIIISSFYWYFLFISIGILCILVSFKMYLLGSMIIGNFLDIYVFGILAVFINWWIKIYYFSYLLFSYLIYLFLHRIEIFLLILSFLESFSSIFQSLTLSNRLSINLISGSLIIELLLVALRLFLLYFILFILIWIIFNFEILNSGIQLFIFSLLFINYYNIKSTYYSIFGFNLHFILGIH